MHKISVLGKIPPPYFGPSIWFDILRKSRLNDIFSIDWFNINVHKEFETLGKRKFKNVLPNILLYVKFYRSLKKHKPELVLIPISQTTIGFIKDSIFIRLASGKSRVVIMLHGSNIRNWLNQSSWLVNRYFSNTIKKTKGVIVLGSKLKYLFYPWFPEDRIFVVPNGFSIAKMPEKEKTEEVIILRYIGNIVKAKGILELLEAVKLLKKCDKNFVLSLIGACPDLALMENCDKIIKDNDLPVRYDGVITGREKIKIFSNTDIFIFTPNKPEGLPMVIIEAMAAGLPIISTDQGAITEAVRDGINGFVVEAGCAEQIAEKIRFLMDNPEIRNQMGKASRDLHTEYFTENKMINGYIEVFTRLLEYGLNQKLNEN